MAGGGAGTGTGGGGGGGGAGGAGGGGGGGGGIGTGGAGGSGGVGGGGVGSGGGWVSTAIAGTHSSAWATAVGAFCQRMPTNSMANRPTWTSRASRNGSAPRPGGLDFLTLRAVFCVAIQGFLCIKICLCVRSRPDKPSDCGGFSGRRLLSWGVA